jgi:hypothetical protein
MAGQGQTLNDRTKLGPSFQLLKMLHVRHAHTMRPNLELKTRPRQLLASLLFDIELQRMTQSQNTNYNSERFFSRAPSIMSSG